MAPPILRSDLTIDVGTVEQETLVELGRLVSKLEAAASKRVDLVLIDEAPPGSIRCRVLLIAGPNGRPRR
jgi:hypothetical protein